MSITITPDCVSLHSNFLDYIDRPSRVVLLSKLTKKTNMTENHPDVFFVLNFNTLFLIGYL